MICLWNLKLQATIWGNGFPFGPDNEEEELSEEDDNESDETTLQDEIDTSGVLDTAAILAQPIFGVNEGPLLDIEDHVSIEANRNGKGKFDPFVDVDGKKVSKPRALRELWKAMISSIPGSTNRLGRVAGLTKFTVKMPSTMDSSSASSGLTSAGPSLFINDPATTLVRCEGNIFLSIVQVTEICVDHESVLEIGPALLMEAIVKIQFQVYQMVEITDADDPDRNDADWKWNLHLENQVLKTRGSNIQVIDPDVSTQLVGHGVYLFKTEELRGLAASLFGSLSQEDQLKIPTVKHTEYFPYRSQGNPSIK
jgi:hypothetical protein